jgi:hypothetical protein
MSNLYDLQLADRASQEHDYFPIDSPLTPESEPSFTFPLSAEPTSCYYHLPGYYALKSDALTGPFEAPYDRDLHPQAESHMDKPLTCSYTSASQSLGT